MYYNPSVEVLRATQNSSSLVASIATQTMHQDLQLVSNPDALCKRLYRSKHLSVFEHASITFRITKVSRSLMAQITRHRLLSFTCSSQHYQDYHGYNWSCEPKYDIFCKEALETYNSFVTEDGDDVFEARQILPNAMNVNMVVTGNARAWMEFLPKRLCKRNVPEMILVANLIHKELKNWFPVFSHVGTTCDEIGICFEGPKMTCGKCQDVR